MPKGGVPVKLREDLMLNTAEVVWLQVHLLHLKPILGEAVTDHQVLTVSIWITCEMLDHVNDINRGVQFSG